MTWMMPLITRRSSTRGLPRVSVGRCGFNFANCSSVSQNWSRFIALLQSETVNHVTPLDETPLWVRTLRQIEMTSRKPNRKFTELSATALADMIARGAVKAEAVAQAFLDRISGEDEAIGAWAHVYASYALDQARALDLHRSTGRAIGSLH